MSDKPNSGGYAFPVPWDGISGRYMTIPGMTLRQLYAAFAMHAIIADQQRQGVSCSRDEIAAWAFDMADSMIAAGESR